MAGALKAFLYCVEVRCPQTGWMVPLIPSWVVSKPRTGEKVIVLAELVPDTGAKRYQIAIRSGVSEEELARREGTDAARGQVRRGLLGPHLDGVDYKTKISTLAGRLYQARWSNRQSSAALGEGRFSPSP